VDLELSELSAAAERLFWRMLSKTDDYGNLPASPKWLRGRARACARHFARRMASPRRHVTILPDVGEVLPDLAEVLADIGQVLAESALRRRRRKRRRTL